WSIQLPVQRPRAVAEVARDLIGACPGVEPHDLARVAGGPRLRRFPRGFPPPTGLSPPGVHLANRVPLPAPPERFDGPLRRFDLDGLAVPFRHHSLSGDGSLTGARAGVRFPWPLSRLEHMFESSLNDTARRPRASSPVFGPKENERLSPVSFRAMKVLALLGSGEF